MLEYAPMRLIAREHSHVAGTGSNRRPLSARQFYRHCERSEAIQSSLTSRERLDRRAAKRRLAMTAEGLHQRHQTLTRHREPPPGGVAIQLSMLPRNHLDCFVAALLAMTEKLASQNPPPLVLLLLVSSRVRL